VAISKVCANINYVQFSPNSCSNSNQTIPKVVHQRNRKGLATSVAMTDNRKSPIDRSSPAGRNHYRNAGTIAKALALLVQDNRKSLPQDFQSALEGHSQKPNKPLLV
jgi:hypothetical protein